MQWRVKLNPRLNHYYYKLCDQRIPHLQAKDVWVCYVGEVLQYCRDVYNHHDLLAFWVRQRSRNVRSFEVLEQRARDIG